MKRILGRKIAQRKSLLRNLSASLVLYERIDTTAAKAKEVKSVVERLITIGKKQDLSSYRRLISYLYDKNAAKKIYRDLVPRYKNRQSGFIKSYRLENRPGDGSEIIRLELVDRKVFIIQAKKPTADVKKTVTEEKVDKKNRRLQKRMEKLTKTKKSAGVITEIRTKAARKTGV